MRSSTSRSASPESSSTIQIFVKNFGGDSKQPSAYSPIMEPLLISTSAFPLTVPEDLSVLNLTTLLSLRTSLPESDLCLVHAGKHLSSSQSLADYNIRRNSTIHLASPLRGGMPPKKIRCTFKTCREGAQRIIGDCGFCNGHYCGKHRLLEDHKCDGLEDVSFSSPISHEPEWWLFGLDSVLGRKLFADICGETVQEGVPRPECRAAQL
jgi:predicted nucleic acid binding AN1-type Zn finger protein